MGNTLPQSQVNESCHSQITIGIIFRLKQLITYVSYGRYVTAVITEVHSKIFWPYFNEPFKAYQIVLIFPKHPGTMEQLWTVSSKQATDGSTVYPPSPLRVLTLMLGSKQSWLMILISINLFYSDQSWALTEYRIGFSFMSIFSTYGTFHELHNVSATLMHSAQSTTLLQIYIPSCPWLTGSQAVYLTAINKELQLVHIWCNPAFSLSLLQPTNIQSHWNCWFRTMEWTDQILPYFTESCWIRDPEEHNWFPIRHTFPNNPKQLAVWGQKCCMSQ